MRLATPFLIGLAVLFSAAADPWTRGTLEADGRLLAAAMPPQQGGEILTIVIEGDGRSHDARGRPTKDPTPKSSVGLQIARAWPSRPAAWLGRPCQYVRAKDPSCSPADWTTHRYSLKSLAATNAAIDALKRQAGAERVVLVGWSGGGVMAVLAAQERTDVAGVVTFAAPLDLAAWTARHGLTPLAASLNPAAREFRVATPQLHYLGSLDGNVPPAVGREAAARLAGASGRVEIRPERHDCCWWKRAAEAQTVLESLMGVRPR